MNNRNTSAQGIASRGGRSDANAAAAGDAFGLRLARARQGAATGQMSRFARNSADDAAYVLPRDACRSISGEMRVGRREVHRRLAPNIAGTNFLSLAYLRRQGDQEKDGCS